MHFEALVDEDTVREFRMCTDLEKLPKKSSEMKQFLKKKMLQLAGTVRTNLVVLIV